MSQKFQHETKDIEAKKLICPKCEISLFNENELISHYIGNHYKVDIECPLCDHPAFSDVSPLVKHLVEVHSAKDFKSVESNEEKGLVDRLPKEGDRIIAMWRESKWQYFTAKIKRFFKESLKYEIDWDDGDPSGRLVDYFNIAKDRIPEEYELGLGTYVLFTQGSYVAGQSRQTGGKRWHQGTITEIVTSEEGKKRYNGHHTKTGADGKFVTYRNYSFNFVELSRNQFRVPPNVFEVADDADVSEIENTSDVFLSYTLVDSYASFKNRELNSADIPSSYLTKYDQMCDPQRIEEFLCKQNLRLSHQVRTGERDAMEVARGIKNARVFVACISDAYANDERCKMEFQYAKLSLKKPVIPVVVGEGSFNWSMTVVGMLIAGELFIHYNDVGVMQAKNKELLSNIQALLGGNETVPTIRNLSLKTTKKADVFVSYCWKNSLKAKQKDQITTIAGNEFSDPRLIKEMISALGYEVWLDVERLNSYEATTGLFGQIARGLNEAQIVIPCISDEYASSQNCRMEFQFAMKSLKKPVIPIIVGNGSKWKNSVVGALLTSCDCASVNLQKVESASQLSAAFKSVEEKLKKSINSKKDKEKRVALSGDRAPRKGDHVLSLHMDWAYYSATVVCYDPTSMTYTVDWDDGDPTGKTTIFNQVAKNVAPEVDDIGVGSLVFFPQGFYRGTDGNNTGGRRYHEGEITAVKKMKDRGVLVSGHHTKGGGDGKWVTYKAYMYEFIDIPLTEIRLAPTALEACLIPK